MALGFTRFVPMLVGLERPHPILERVYDVAAPQWKMTLPPFAAHAMPTLRQQIDSLPVHIASAWRSRYANEGTDLEARAIIGREAAAVRVAGQEPDALAVWIRLADAAGRQREPPPALVAAAALAGLAAGVRTQGFFEVPIKADPAL